MRVYVCHAESQPYYSRRLVSSIDYIDLADAASRLGDIRQARAEAVKSKGEDEDREDAICTIHEVPGIVPNN